jgi:hypothetical protein
LCLISQLDKTRRYDSQVHIVVHIVFAKN